MSSQTTNLDLTKWDSPSDVFDSGELAENFQKIDDDFNRARPTDRAEILAALPVSGNFNGRLVFLSAASGGFAAGTLVRYYGSWAAVGPFEVLSAVPGTGNYAGRIVLLSAASSGFAAWTLIRYNGTSWGPANNSYEVQATIPSTGNFAGRIVLITSADQGYAAYSMLVYTGSAWKLIGPEPVPPGTELVYSVVSSDTTTTNTADPGTNLITFAAATYENVKYYIDIDIPRISHTVASADIHMNLYESTTPIGSPFVFRLPATAGAPTSFSSKKAFTPTAASHTYLVNWWLSTAGTGSILTSGFAPATFRIFKA